MKPFVSLAMLLCLITAAFEQAARSAPPEKDIISTYEQLDARAGEAKEQLKRDAAIAELAPLRGKTTAPLSATQASQLALLAINYAMIKAGHMVLIMQELDKPFQTDNFQPLSKLAKDSPKKLAQKARAAIASLPKELTTDFRYMQRETYSDAAAITVQVKMLLTDSLIKEGLELLRSRPLGLPDLASKLTADGLWKSILFYCQDRDGLADATYFDRLDNWGALIPLDNT